MEILTPTNTRIIISHFNEDIHWTERLKEQGFEVFVYTKCNPKSPYNVPANKGQEASAYLKYIIDFYSSLSEYTIFLHGHEKSYHVDGSIVDRIKENIGKEHSFFNLNNYVLGSILKKKDIFSWYKMYMEPYLGKSELYGDWTLGHKGCAQFIVHKDLILLRPKEFYERLYKWITTTKTRNEISSRYMEWTWHLIWGQVKFETNIAQLSSK